MSPTIFRERGFRFFFFSREEPRMHVHVHSGREEAKFWLEPVIEPAHNYGLTDKDMATAKALIERHEHEIRRAWEKYFSG